MSWHKEARLALLATIAGACVGLGEPSRILAAPLWTGAADSAWSNTSNWSTGSLPANSSTLGHPEFVDAGAANFSSIAFGSSVTIRSMTFNANSASGVTINGMTTANRPTFSGSNNVGIGGTNVRIKVDAGNHTLAGAKVGGSSYDVGIGATGSGTTAIHIWEVAADASLLFDATLGRSGSGDLEIHKTGDGTVTLGGATSMSQAHYMVDDGTLAFGASGVRGNSGTPITVNAGGTLQLNNQAYGGNNGVLTLNGTGHNGMGALFATGGGDNSVASTSSPSSSTPGEAIGQVIIASDSSIGVDAGSELRWTHGIESSGTGNLTKVGAGTLIFEANNALPEYGYSGTITVAEGTLLLNSQANTVMVTGDIIVSSSTNRNITLVNNDSIRVGQLVSGPGVSAGKFLTSVSSTSESVTVNEFLLTATTAETYTFYGINSALNTSPVVVQSGATFGGSGSILGSSVTVDDGATLAPGLSIGVLTAGSVVLAGTLAIEIDESDPLVNDRLHVAGNLDLTGASAQFSISGPLTSSSYLLATYDGVLTGAFNPDDAPHGYHFDYSSKGEVRLTVPEPSKFALLCLACAGLFAWSRRNRN